MIEMFLQTLQSIFKVAARILSGKSWGVKSSTQIKVKDRWVSKIQPAFSSQGTSALRQAVLEADKLLSLVLADLVAGETLGQRLKNARNIFPYDLYNRAWQAHKVRNALAHDLDFEPTGDMLRDTLRDFEAVIRSLGVSL